METYITKDKQVVKYVHDDGSETTIKTVSSCDNILNKATGNIEIVDVDRQKFSCFVSCSVGCPIGCKFCYLTVKKFPYHKLSSFEIIENVKEALADRLCFKVLNIQHDTGINDKYMKLSWMGMGDALLLDPMVVYGVTKEILDYVTGLCLVEGIDGVDIGTVLPNGPKGWPFNLGMMNMMLREEYKINPLNKGRSPVRLFYSLHHGDLIPIRKSIYADFETLRKINHDFGVDVIIHHMFLEGINDNKKSLDDIKKLFNQYEFYPELRILRYNECPNSSHKETKRFDELVKHASDIFPKIKYQISAGSEIKAACGQFICKVMKKG